MEISKVIHETKRANSVEVGPAGQRWKIYFEDPEDLKEKVDALRNAGYEINLGFEV